MSKVVKMITVAIVVTIILIVAVAGPVFADNPDKGKMNQNQNGDCVCDDGECVPNEYYHHYYWLGEKWLGEKGPHGAQHGKVTE
ncbi:hypothetical protein ACFLV5_01900 [Chloroflexota bacterium]